MKKFILMIIALFVLTQWSYAADEWTKAEFDDSQLFATAPGVMRANNEALDRVMSNYREGMKLTYSSAAAISVSAGEVVCSNSDGSLRKMRANTEATSVTFSDIDTGAEAGSTTYYVYAVADADATTATFKISLSATTPTGATYFKRLGSFYNDGSSNITADNIWNDNETSGTEYQNSIVYFNGAYIKDALLGRTTTGTTIFNNGTDVTCPAGCYITGGIKQSDSNFTYFNYACP